MTPDLFALRVQVVTKTATSSQETAYKTNTNDDIGNTHMWYT